MIGHAISCAESNGINVQCGVENLANGDCAFETIIDGISTRFCFGETDDRTVKGGMGKIKEVWCL